MTEETQLIERIDNVQDFLQDAGKYHTSTAHQAYSVLKALGWHPWVKLGEELYFPEGSVLFAEVRPLTPNVDKMGWGTTDDYYERRLRDYDNWEVAFWRELIQNSRDSGATRIDIECVADVYEDPESGDRVECVRASASDNGRGMNYDTLMTAFFRRGGTLKQEGSVGGFGDAKNLILTPWLGYEVRSHDVVVRGRHEELFADLTRQGMPFHEGTKVTVWMPLVKTTTPEYAQFLIEQSALENIRFSINGKRVKGRLPNAKLTRTLDIKVGADVVGKLLVYHSPRARRKGVYVRSHGLYMFELHGYDGNFKGVVNVEVNAPPVDVFTTKRDALSFRSSARIDLNHILKELSSDPRQLLREERKNQKPQLFKGTGSIDVRKGRVAEMAANIASRVDLELEKRDKNGAIKVSKHAQSVMLDAFVIYAEKSSGEDSDGPTIEPLPSTFDTMISQMSFVDTTQIVGAVQLAMWRPDFLLVEKLYPWKMPKRLHPHTMQNKYHVLLAVWTEVCKFLLVQFGMFDTFGVGWIFDSEYNEGTDAESVIAAAYKIDEGQHWLLLNPVDIEQHGSGDSASFKILGDRFKLSDPYDIEKIVTLAVHEITHMQGFTGHDDAYSSALTANMQAVFRIAPVLKKIVKEARASVREVRKATEAAKPKSSRPKSAYSWHKLDGQIYAMRNSDRLYVGYIEHKAEGTSWYDVYIAMEPSDPTDVRYDGLWVGSQPSERKAKKSLTDLAKKKFETSEIPAEPSVIEWDQSDMDVVGTTVYGYDPESNATRATVFIIDTGRYNPRAWDVAMEEWADGPEQATLRDAKETAERLYAKLNGFGDRHGNPKQDVRFIWDPDEGNQFTYGMSTDSNATTVSVMRQTRRYQDTSGRMREEEFYVPRIYVNEAWHEGSPTYKLDSAKTKAEELYRKLL